MRVTGVVLVLTFLVISSVSTHVGLRPLRIVTRTARRIADGDRAERVPDGPRSTEIGDLSSSFNEMLGALDEANAEVAAAAERTRRFAADAAHELRTPVTAIRGYAELYSRGAVQGRERTDEVFGRIGHEADRMRDLVEALLLLDRIESWSRLPLEARNEERGRSGKSEAYWRSVSTAVGSSLGLAIVHALMTEAAAR